MKKGYLFEGQRSLFRNFSKYSFLLLFFIFLIPFLSATDSFGYDNKAQNSPFGYNKLETETVSTTTIISNGTGGGSNDTTWSYNQTNAEHSIYNVTYATYAYNQSLSPTITIWLYNQTFSAIEILNGTYGGLFYNHTIATYSQYFPNVAYQNNSNNFTTNQIINGNLTLQNGGALYLPILNITPSDVTGLGVFFIDNITGDNIPKVRVGGLEYDLTGGGGGCTTLDCLSDTLLNSPQDLDSLVNINGAWINYVLSHNNLTDIGTINHTAIDTHILNTTGNPHGVNTSQISAPHLAGDNTFTGLNDFTQLPTVPTTLPTSDNQVLSYGQGRQLAQNLSYRQPVLNFSKSAPPASIVGDRYRVLPPGSGNWTGLDNYLVENISGNWTPEGPPQNGWTVVALDENKIYRYDTTDMDWVLVGTQTVYTSGDGTDITANQINVSITDNSALNFSLGKLGLSYDISKFIITNNKLNLKQGSVNASDIVATLSNQIYNHTLTANDSIYGAYGKYFYNQSGGGGTDVPTNGGFQIKIKPANEALALSAVLQNDDDLFFNIAENEEWTILYNLFVNTSSATPDITVAIKAPAGAFCFISATSDSGGSNVAKACNTATILPLPANQNGRNVQVVAKVKNAGTAGQVNLSWAQSASNAAAIAILNGSYLWAVDSRGILGNVSVEGGAGGSSLFESNATKIWNSTTLGLGIGTNNPATTLHVNSSGSTELRLEGGGAGSPFLSLHQDSTRRGFLQWNNAGEMKLASEYGNISFYTGFGGAETIKAIITDSGNVGIGTATPVTKLNVLETKLAGGLAYGLNVSSISVGGNNAIGQTILAHETDGTGTAYGLIVDAIGFNSYGIYSTAADNYFSGNVGIGTSNPQAKLDVRGDIVVGDQVANAYNQIFYNSGGGTSITLNGDEGTITSTGQICDSTGCIPAGGGGASGWKTNATAVYNDTSRYLGFGSARIGLNTAIPTATFFTLANANERINLEFWRNSNTLNNNDGLGLISAWAGTTPTNIATIQFGTNGTAENSGQIWFYTRSVTGTGIQINQVITGNGTVGFGHNIIAPDNDFKVHVSGDALGVTSTLQVTPNVATGAGDLYVEGDVEFDGIPAWTGDSYLCYTTSNGTITWGAFGCGGGASPFLNIYSGKVMLETIEFNANLNEASKETLQSQEFKSLKVNDYTYEIENRKPETDYIDMVELIVVGINTGVKEKTGQLHYYTLQINKEELKETDEKRIVLESGEKIKVEFEQLPKTFIPLSVQLVSEGYYIPYPRE